MEKKTEKKQVVVAAIPKKVIAQQVIFRKCAKTEDGYVAHGGIGDLPTVPMGTYKIDGDLKGVGEVFPNGVNVSMTFKESPALHKFYSLTFD